MKRRDFITALVGAAANWPLTARAQQAPMPVVGLLSGGTLEADAFRISAFRQGLAESGYAVGRNVTLEYRGASGRYDQLPALAKEVVNSQVKVISTLGPTLAAL